MACLCSHSIESNMSCVLVLWHCCVLTVLRATCRSCCCYDTVVSSQFREQHVVRAGVVTLLCPHSTESNMSFVLVLWHSCVLTVPRATCRSCWCCDTVVSSQYREQHVVRAGVMTLLYLHSTESNIFVLVLWHCCVLTVPRATCRSCCCYDTVVSSQYRDQHGVCAGVLTLLCPHSTDIQHVVRAGVMTLLCPHTTESNMSCLLVFSHCCVLTVPRATCRACWCSSAFTTSVWPLPSGCWYSPTAGTASSTHSVSDTHARLQLELFF